MRGLLWYLLHKSDTEQSFSKDKGGSKYLHTLNVLKQEKALHWQVSSWNDI